MIELKCPFWRFWNLKFSQKITNKIVYASIGYFLNVNSFEHKSLACYKSSFFNALHITSIVNSYTHFKKTCYKNIFIS